jgi:alpha-L-rhamnosidase
VIYDMNSRSDVPGYGYQLAHGATALTESWAALPSVSNNHFMLGHLMEWFYSGLAGIRPADDAIAFNKIEIRPETVGDVTGAKANYQSPYGNIVSSWKKDKTQFKLEVSIPVNTTASIFLPVKSNAAITVDGQNIKTRHDLKFVGYHDGKAEIKAGSGNYTFIAQ